MTDRQMKFCYEYLKDLNASQAAIRAGYSKKSSREQGARLMKKAKVEEMIQRLIQEQQGESVAETEEILSFLTSVMRGNVSEATPLYMSRGEQQLINKKVGAAERIRAAELLGKRYALWTDKVEQTNKNIEINIGDWDADDQD